MSEIQQEFEKVVATLRHDGEILTFSDPPQRGILTTPEVICGFMKGAEDVIGFRGAKVLMYSTGYNAAYRMAQHLNRNKNFTLEQAFMAYLDNAFLRGWGRGVPLNCDPQTGYAKLEMKNSIFAVTYAGKGDTVCQFFAGAFAGIMAGYREKKAQGFEMNCQAAGDAVCTFEIKSIE